MQQLNEKLDLISKYLKGEIQLEVKRLNKWEELGYLDDNLFSLDGDEHAFTLDSIVAGEIRIKPDFMMPREKFQAFAELSVTGEIFEYEHFIGTRYFGRFVINQDGAYGEFQNSIDGIHFVPNEMKINNLLQNIRWIRRV